MSHETTNYTHQCGCRRDCETSARNNYYDRKPLTPLSFQVEQAYGIERRRLLNRTIHGWGVVYGYSIKPDDEGEGTALQIGEGLALDIYGRELLYLGGPIRADELICLEGDQSDRSEEEPELWLLSVHYAEKSAGPVTSRDSCRHEWTEWDQTCETVRFSIKPVQSNSKDNPSDEPSDCSQAAMEQTATTLECRTLDQLLCEHLSKLPIENKPGRLKRIDEPDGPVFVDKHHGVPLAYLTVEGDANKPPVFNIVDVCAPRRLVKRNDLLFDLIRAGDLTHISRIGWEKWHTSPAEIDFAKFAAALSPEKPGAEKPGDDAQAQRFDIEFSAPVVPPTRSEDCFAMTILIPGGEGGWWRNLRAPITKVEWNDDEGLCNRATLWFDAGWVNEAVLGHYRLFHNRPTRVEIEVRCDLILDCHGRAVDGNAIGRKLPPTGNGTPGGTFLSTFHVGPAGSQTQASAEEPKL